MIRIFLFFALMCVPNIGSAHDVQSIRYYELNGKATIKTTGKATTPQTPFAIASVGKTMTSVAVLRLVTRGMLNLDDPVSMYFNAEVTTGLGGLNGITVRHLLAMTSGLPDYLSDAYIIDAIENPTTVQTAKVALTYAYDLPVLFNPGGQFDYSNTNYVMLGLILERITGKSYSDIIKAEVFDPSGMLNSFVFGSRDLPNTFPTGHEGRKHIGDYYEYDGFGDGGVISTAVDVARFYKALFVQKTLLAPAIMIELMHDAVAENYGLGIDIEGNILGHSGGDLGYTSDVRINVDTGAIAIILSAKSDANTRWTNDALQ